MSNNHPKTLSAATLGALFVGSLAAAPLASAAENPFGMTSLQGGYSVASSHGGGEGRCGGDKAADQAKDKMKEGKCGEGRCGGDKATDQAKDKMKEGKCGEGRCGGSR